MLVIYPLPKESALSHAHARERARHNIGSEAACAFTRSAAFGGNVTDQRVDPRDAPTENNTRAFVHARDDPHHPHHQYPPPPTPQPRAT